MSRYVPHWVPYAMPFAEIEHPQTKHYNKALMELMRRMRPVADGT